MAKQNNDIKTSYIKVKIDNRDTKSFIIYANEGN